MDSPNWEVVSLNKEMDCLNYEVDSPNQETV